MSKKIFIKTFGCQMNEYDSNRIYDIVSNIGIEKTQKKNENSSANKRKIQPQIDQKAPKRPKCAQQHLQNT